MDRLKLNLIGQVKTDQNNISISTNHPFSDFKNNPEDDCNEKNDNFFENLQENTKKYKKIETDFDNNKAKSFDQSTFANKINSKYAINIENDKTIKQNVDKQMSLPENMNFSIYSGAEKGKFLD